MNNGDNQTSNLEIDEHTKEILDVLAWEMYVLPRQVECDSLYHYYNGETVPLVLRKDGIQFRLAALSTFEDKMEGKSVEVYYDLALQELLLERSITNVDYEELIKIKVPDKAYLMYLPKDGLGKGHFCEYNEYVICFSKAKDDHYMYENYCKDSDGYCLEFPVIELKEVTCMSLRNSAEMMLMPVLYGREVVEYIKHIVLEVLNEPAKRHHLEECIQSLLHIVQFSAKLSKYSLEREVRLITLLPKKLEYDLPNIRYAESDDSKQYIYLNVEKYVLTGISAAPFNAKQETLKIMHTIKENGYSDIK